MSTLPTAKPALKIAPDAPGMVMASATGRQAPHGASRAINAPLKNFWRNACLI